MQFQNIIPKNFEPQFEIIDHLNMSYTNHLIDSYHRIEKFRKKSDMSWMEKVSIIYSYRIYIFRLSKNICFVKLYSRMLLNSSWFFTIFALCPPLLLPHRFMGQLCLTPRSPGGSLLWQWLLERPLSYGAGRQHYWTNLSILPSPVITCLKKLNWKSYLTLLLLPMVMAVHWALYSVLLYIWPNHFFSLGDHSPGNCKYSEKFVFICDFFSSFAWR